MAKKQEWTVRVIVYETGNSLDLPGIWMEQFRYMSYARELAHPQPQPHGRDDRKAEARSAECLKGVLLVYSTR